MDFGTFMDLFHNAPVDIGSATPLASMPGGLNSANVDQYAPGQIQAPQQSPLAMLGQSLQSGSKDPGLQNIPMAQQHRSAFLMNILPQLMNSIGSNMLGRMGSM